MSETSARPLLAVLRARGFESPWARRLAVGAALLVVLSSAFALRATGGDWDETKHLHPDERYLATVADNLEAPDGVGGYFDVERSPLSPYNEEKARDYIYGTLPLFATKLVAAALGQDRYGELTRVGRTLAAILDTLTVALVFAIALLVLGRFGARRAALGALVAAALYALTVTAIQHAHFFTAETWLVFFTTLTLFLALCSVDAAAAGRWTGVPLVVALTGVALGLTIACKVSGAVAGAPVAVALAGRFLLARRRSGTAAASVGLAAESVTIVSTAYLSFRAVSPYTFAHSNWLDVSLNASFRDALARQAQATAGETLAPPSYQWLLSTPILSPLENLALWQLGLPFAAIGLGGLLLVSARLAQAAARVVRTGRADELVPDVQRLALVCLVLAVFVAFATRFVHSGRYLVPLVPPLAVLAAAGVLAVAARRPRLGAAVTVLAVGGTAVWALAFTSIYRHENTRLAASAWLSANAPPGATIANEHWDDPLPIGAIWVPHAAAAAGVGYVGILLPVFDPDDAVKLRRLYDELARTDYYVLSSPRAWRTVGRLPDRFPLMTRLYERLFAGDLGFSEVASFSSRPSLLGVELDDLRAEEAFWVYDHAPVRILRRDEPLEWQRFRAALCVPAADYCA